MCAKKNVLFGELNYYLVTTKILLYPGKVLWKIKYEKLSNPLSF